MRQYLLTFLNITGLKYDGTKRVYHLSVKSQKSMFLFLVRSCLTNLNFITDVLGVWWLISHRHMEWPILVHFVRLFWLHYSLVDREIYMFCSTGRSVSSKLNSWPEMQKN